MTVKLASSMERTPGKDTRAAATPGDEGLPPIEAIASMGRDDVLDLLGTRATGLTDTEADVRLRSFGPNAVRTHHANALAVLARQLRSALLLLLLAAAVVSAFVEQDADAPASSASSSPASVGLGFANEYRAELAAEALHSRSAISSRWNGRARRRLSK